MNTCGLLINMFKDVGDNKESLLEVKESLELCLEVGDEEVAGATTLGILNVMFNGYLLAKGESPVKDNFDIFMIEAIKQLEEDLK